MFLTNFEFWSTPWPYILLWFVVVVFSVMVEINTLQIVSIWFAASGAVSMILASVGCKPEVQIGVFFVLSDFVFGGGIVDTSKRNTTG